VSSDRPVFVVGCPRSGTTLLSLMIHAHPRLAMPPETRFLIRLWRKREKFGDLTTPKQRRRLARACTKGARLGHLGLDRRTTRRAIRAAPPTLGSAFGTVFAEFARTQGKARWGDKRPLYYQEVDVLLRLFPDAQIVHCIRDPRATVASLKRMPWWPYDSIGAMAAWSHAEWCARRSRRRLPANTFHLVRYESLVADPQRVLRELCAFLEEDFDEAMLAPARIRHLIPESKSWHDNLGSDVSSDRVEAWRSQLEPWETGLIELVLRRKLARWGYQRSGAGRTPGPVRIGRYVVAALKRHLSTRLRWAREARDTARSTQPIAAGLTTRQRELLRPS
jgi:hypothetical protein